MALKPKLTTMPVLIASCLMCFSNVLLSAPAQPENVRTGDPELAEMTDSPFLLLSRYFSHLKHEWIEVSLVENNWNGDIRHLFLNRSVSETSGNYCRILNSALSRRHFTEQSSVSNMLRDLHLNSAGGKTGDRKKELNSEFSLSSYFFSSYQLDCLAANHKAFITSCKQPMSDI